MQKNVKNEINEASENVKFGICHFFWLHKFEIVQNRGTISSIENVRAQIDKKTTVQFGLWQKTFTVMIYI